MNEAEIALIVQEARYGADCPVSGDFDAAVKDAILSPTGTAGSGTVEVTGVGAQPAHECGEDCQHESSCALHNAPALPVGPCDCKLNDGLDDDDRKLLDALEGEYANADDALAAAGTIRNYAKQLADLRLK